MTGRMVLAFGRALEAPDVEAVLAELCSRERPRDLTAERLRTHGLCLDLTRVEHADFGALAHLALVVEHLVRRRIRVGVTLPAPHILEPDLERFDAMAGAGDSADRRRAEFATRARARARCRALQFLRVSGFETSVACEHVPDAAQLVTVTVAAAPADGDAAATSAATRHLGEEITEPPRDVPLPRRILPLHWVPRWPTDDRRSSWEREVTRLLSLKGLALTLGEARALAELLLRELIDNVHAHAGELSDVSAPPAALVGAVFLDNSVDRDTRSGLGQMARGYFDWLESVHASALRVVVGDSGTGIDAMLDPRLRNNERHRAGTETRGRPERSVFWSLTPWSSMNPAISDEGRSRGLASVRRMVRQESGAYLVRTGEIIAGMVYPGGERAELSAAGQAWSPGTLLDVTLARRPVAEPETWYSATESALLPPAGLILFEIGEDSTIDVASSLRAAYQCLAGGERGFLVANVPVGEMSDDIAHKVFGQILELADELADDTRLVVLAVASSGSRFFPQARAYDDLHSQDQRPQPAPVMLLDEKGRSAWLGAGKLAGRILWRLTAARGEPLQINAVAREFGVTEAAALRAALGMHEWMTSGGGELQLRVTPGAVDAALPTLLRSRMVSALDDPTVAREGPVVVPSLERPTVWVDRSKLIDRMGGPHLVGYTLAKLVRARFPDLCTPKTHLIRLTLLPEALAHAFRVALGLASREYSLAGEAGLYDDSRISFIRPSTPLIFLTDTIIGGSTVRGAVVDMMRTGADPKLVVSLIDSGCSTELSRHLGSPPGFVSLMSVDGMPTADGPVTIIEPLRSSTGAEYTPPVLDYRIPPSTLLEWCRSSPEAVLTGHIARCVQRHFSTFFAADTLLRPGSDSENVIGATISTEILAYLDELGGPGAHNQNVQIWFPRPAGDVAGEADDVAGDLATLVSRVLADHHSQTMTRLSSVERVRADDRWVFPPLPAELPPRTHVVIVDWGAVTTTTVQRLMGLAVDGGASSVHGIIFASQARAEDEVTARRIRRLGRVERNERSVPHRGTDATAPRAAAMSPGAETPARISFISSIRVGYEPAAECRMCELAREYSDRGRSAPAELVREHARQMASALEPCSLAEAKRNGPSDLLGEAVTADEVVRILDWRGELEAARASTARRLAFVERLAALTANSAGTDGDLICLVRLLLLEPRWLKLPPARLSKVRVLLAGLIRAAIDGERFEQLPSTVQRQLVIVLRAVSKLSFLEALPDALYSTVRAAPRLDVAGDLLWGVYTIVIRQYNRGRPVMSTARQALLEAAARIEESPELRFEGRTLELISTLTSLVALCDYLELSSPAASHRVHDVWARLREHYYRIAIDHRDAATKMSNIVTAVQVSSIRDSEKWLSSFDDWRYVQQFLVQHVLPFLPAVQHIVAPHLEEVGSREDIEGWELALTSNVVAELNSIGDLLRKFIAEPSAAVRERGSIRNRIEWWHKFFFQRNPHPEEFPLPSLLRLLHDCPCNVEEWVRYGAQFGKEAARRTGRPLRSVVIRPTGRPGQVFIRAQVLEGAVQQLVENAGKHQADPAGGGEVAIAVTDSETTATVTVRNTGSRPSDRPGGGILRITQALAPYGASLEVEEAPVPPWTYEVRIILRKWVSRAAVKPNGRAADGSMR